MTMPPCCAVVRATGAALKSLVRPASLPNAIASGAVRFAPLGTLL